MCFSRPKVKKAPRIVDPPEEDAPGEVLIADRAASKRGTRRLYRGRQALLHGLNLKPRDTSYS